MRRARAFFYVCGGILALVIAFHLGAGQAQSQAPGNPVVAVTLTGYSTPVFLAITANGDVYRGFNPDGSGQWTHATNIFSGGPISTERATWGRVKADRR